MLTSSLIRGRGPVFVLILLTLVLAGTSCSSDVEESPAEPSATTHPVTTATTAAPAATTAPTTTIAPAATTTVTPGTTTTAAPTTATTFPTEESLNYLDMVLAAEADIGEFAKEVRAVNHRWDTGAGDAVAYRDIEAALEAAIERAPQLREAFELIEPPTGHGIQNEHQKAHTAFGVMADMVPEMLDGLRSTDTGQVRKAALLRFTAAFDIFKKVLDRVAAVIGDEGIAAVETARTGTTTVDEGEESDGVSSEETTTTTTQPITTTTAAPVTTTTTTTTTTTAAPVTTTTTTTTETGTAAGVKAEWWRPGLAEEALALIDPASVAADNWSLIAEEKNYGTRAFFRFDFLNTPVSDGDGFTQEHQKEIGAFEKALASARLVLEQSPVIYYPYRYDIRWVEYPSVISVTGAFPRGETRQLLTRQSGSSWTADQGIDVPGGPPIRPTTPFAAPRWADTAGVLGRNCKPVEEIWTRGSPVTDSCTLSAIETALDYLWTGSSELRQRAVRDGHVLTDLFGRLDNQANAYLAGLYGETARAGVITNVRNVRWAGNWAGASMIHFKYQNVHPDRELTEKERQDAISYFTGLSEQGIDVDSRFLRGRFTMGFAWDWKNALMVRTADGTWRMSYRSFCQFHRTLHVVDQPLFLCPGDPTPYFPDSEFYDRDLWPPNHVHYYSDPRQESSPRFNAKYLGVPPS